MPSPVIPFRSVVIALVVALTILVAPVAEVKADGPDRLTTLAKLRSELREKSKITEPKEKLAPGAAKTKGILIEHP